MSSVVGTYRSGRVDLEEPVVWPDGHKVIVSDPPMGKFLVESEWPDTPENRAEIRRRMAKLDELQLSEEEIACIEAALDESKRFNKEVMRKQMESGV